MVHIYPKKHQFPFHVPLSVPFDSPLGAIGGDTKSLDYTLNPKPKP